jgi:hypothetical protein
VAIEWKPHVGAGALAPLGTKWGALLDVTTSAVEGYWNPGGMPGAAGLESNSSRERRVAFTPAIVRLWRRQHFSIYAGAGIGAELARQRSRTRPVIGFDSQGNPILGGNFVVTNTSKTEAMLVLRLGTLISLSPRVVLRAGFSVFPRYADETASKSFEFGIGYRF